MLDLSDHFANCHIPWLRSVTTFQFYVNPNDCLKSVWILLKWYLLNHFIKMKITVKLELGMRQLCLVMIWEFVFTESVPKKATENPVHVDLSTSTEEIMDFWVCRFITEMNTSQGLSNCGFVYTCKILVFLNIVAKYWDS